MAGGWHIQDPSLWQLAGIWLVFTTLAALYIGALAGIVILIVEYVV